MEKDEKNGIELDSVESEEFPSKKENTFYIDEIIPKEHIIETKEESLDVKNCMESKDTIVEMMDEEEESLDDLFQGVSAALAEQVEKEFGGKIETSASLEQSSKQQNKFLKVWNNIPTWAKILVSVIFGIVLCIGLLFGTKPGQKLLYNIAVDFVFDRINVDKEGTPTPIPELTVTLEPTKEPTGEPTPTSEPEPTKEPEATATSTPTNTPTPTPTPYPTVAVSSKSMKQDENVVNILLLGEENIYGDTRGRTDAILVASLDKRTGQISLVSFLRDTYVRIPGYADNRINASFSQGGARLTMDTIETNFKIKLDGYVKVNFSGFEDIINKLGGLEISLTEEESEYLNTTKYISRPSQRNTVPGYQNMTGSQVLGYCRVRHVPTANGLYNDFGRTYRHRVVLQALFDKYKEKSIVELLSVMNSCFSYVTASESLKEIAAECLQVVVEKKNFDIQTLQIPKSGHYSGATIRGMEVIVYYPDNVDVIQDFLYSE